jgi:hypothetical protein
LDDVVFLLGGIGLPLAVGAALGYFAKPWWWAVVAAVALFLLFVIVPAPEEGESRVAGDDVAFLAVATLFVAAIAWIGALFGRRLAARRPVSSET